MAKRGSIVYEGYLKRKLANQSSFETHYWILYENNLARFASPTDRDPVENISIKWKKFEVSGYTSFTLTGVKGTTVFYTDSAEELVQWKQILILRAIWSKFLDDYKVNQELNSNSKTRIYKWLHKASKELRAVKTISTVYVTAKQSRMKNIANEIQIMRTLNHSFIVKLYEVYVDSDYIHLVLDYVPYGTLYSRILRRQRFSERNAGAFTKNILEVLVYLHSRNIIHRDLKPENILMTSEYDDTKFKIIDFGLAEIQDSSKLSFCGSPGYMAPEVLMQESYSTKSDVFSVGVILYVLLCGRSPFPGDGNQDVFQKNREWKIFFQEEYWKTVSKLAFQIVLSMLQSSQNRRLSAEQALQHEWIQRVRDSSDERRDLTPPSAYIPKIKKPKAISDLFERGQHQNSAQTPGSIFMRPLDRENVPQIGMDPIVSRPKINPDKAIPKSKIDSIMKMLRGSDPELMKIEEVKEVKIKPRQRGFNNLKIRQEPREKIEVFSMECKPASRLFMGAEDTCLSQNIIIYKMRLSFGGGGSVLDEQRSITKAMASGKTSRYIPQLNSLNFFLQTSEERLQRSKRGQDLAEILVEHGKIIPEKQPKHATLEPCRLTNASTTQVRNVKFPPKKITHSASTEALPTTVRKKTYFSIEAMSQDAKLEVSPAMNHYISLKNFDSKVEKRKHRNIKNHFFEKYQHVSDFLNEDQIALMKAEDNKKLENLRIEMQAPRRRTRAKLQTVKRKGLFAQIDSINQQIKDELQEELQNEKNGTGNSESQLTDLKQYKNALSIARRRSAAESFRMQKPSVMPSPLKQTSQRSPIPYKSHQLKPGYLVPISSWTSLRRSSRHTSSVSSMPKYTKSMSMAVSAEADKQILNPKKLLSELKQMGQKMSPKKKESIEYDLD